MDSSTTRLVRVRELHLKSVLRVSLLSAVVFTVAEAVLFIVTGVALAALGVVGALSRLVQDVTSSNANSGIDITSYFNVAVVILALFSLLLLNIFFATMWSLFLTGTYNVVARHFGGVDVTVTEV